MIQIVKVKQKDLVKNSKKTKELTILTCRS